MADAGDLATPYGQRWLPRRMLWRGGAFGIHYDVGLRIRQLSDLGSAGSEQRSGGGGNGELPALEVQDE
jgi:hypothetical protein